MLSTTALVVLAGIFVLAAVLLVVPRLIGRSSSEHSRDSDQDES